MAYKVTESTGTLLGFLPIWNGMAKAALYVRVSSKDQAKQ